MTYAALEAKAKSLSQRGLRLALWQEGGNWHWAWEFTYEGNITISNGFTDAQPKPVALAFALMSI